MFWQIVKIRKNQFYHFPECCFECSDDEAFCGDVSSREPDDAAAGMTPIAGYQVAENGHQTFVNNLQTKIEQFFFQKPKIIKILVCFKKPLKRNLKSNIYE